MDVISVVLSSAVAGALAGAVVTLVAIGKYRERVNTSTQSIEKHDDKISEISDRVSRLEGGVDRDRAHSEYIQRKSPLSLTAKGKAVLLDSKGKDFVDDNKDALLAKIKKAKPATAYDVQELSKKVIMDDSNTANFNSIKQFAFSKGLDLSLIIDIMAIYLRDEALPDFGFDAADLPD